MSESDLSKYMPFYEYCVGDALIDAMNRKRTIKAQLARQVYKPLVMTMFFLVAIGAIRPKRKSGK